MRQALFAGHGVPGHQFILASRAELCHLGAGFGGVFSIVSVVVAFGQITDCYIVGSGFHAPAVLVLTTVRHGSFFQRFVARIVRNARQHLTGLGGGLCQLSKG